MIPPPEQVGEARVELVDVGRGILDDRPNLLHQGPDEDEEELHEDERRHHVDEQDEKTPRDPPPRDRDPRQALDDRIQEVDDEDPDDEGSEDVAPDPEQDREDRDAREQDEDPPRRHRQARRRAGGGCGRSGGSLHLSGRLPRVTHPSGDRRDPSAESPASAPPPLPTAPARQRWRLFVAVPAPAGADREGDPGGRRSWPALLSSAGLPVAGEGAGRGRVVPAAPLPVGAAGEREVVDLYLAERLPARAVRAAVAAVLPPGLSLVDLHDVWVGAPSAPAAVVAADYRVQVAGAPRRVVEDAVLALLGAAALPRERRREKKTTAYDLRPLILGLEIRGSDEIGVTLAMRLRHAAEAVGRPDEVVAALGEPPAPALPGPLTVRSLVRERIVMADDPDASSMR